MRQGRVVQQRELERVERLDVEQQLLPGELELVGLPRHRRAPQMRDAERPLGLHLAIEPVPVEVSLQLGAPGLR
jgi:hypothetical protein